MIRVLLTSYTVEKPYERNRFIKNYNRIFKSRIDTHQLMEILSKHFNFVLGIFFLNIKIQLKFSNFAGHPVNCVHDTLTKPTENKPNSIGLRLSSNLATMGDFLRRHEAGVERRIGA